MPRDRCPSCDAPMLPAQTVCQSCGWVRPSKTEAETDIVRTIAFVMIAALIVIVAAVTGLRP